MSGACGTCGVEEGCMLSFDGEMKKRGHLEDQALDLWGLILKWILQK